jgi:hypothetical protein
MTSHKDAFMEARERETILLSSPEQDELERLNILEYLRGNNITVKKLNHADISDNNLPDGDNAVPDGLWVCKKTDSGRHGHASDVTLHSPHSPSDKTPVPCDRP